MEALRREYRIITPQQFLDNLQTGRSDPSEICLCFDCGLKSQYDIALPVLDAQGLKAFWFLYTSVFQGHIVPIEQYHHFRFFCFEDVNDFYLAFFQKLEACSPARFARGVDEFNRCGYLNWAGFYTREDRLFKFMRDKVLDTSEFDEIMQAMMRDADYDVSRHRHNLWLTPAEVRRLSDDGHIIGMHTHTHPNAIGSLSYEEQLLEYRTNQQILREITQKPVRCMSHPCNSYNTDTLRILRELGIEAGFRADRNPNYHSRYELPRIDHSEWIRSHRELKIWQ